MEMATLAKRDYYEILGVGRTATQQEIKNAFEQLTAQFHAAGRPSNMDDVEWLRQVKKAYDVLTNGASRDRYDRGDASSSNPGQSGGYDLAEMRRLADSVDRDVRAKRIRFIIHGILRFFGLR